MATQTFEEAIAEYIERCYESVGKEREEGHPPGPGTPYPIGEPPYEAAIRLDERTVRNYALSIGNTNPLYTDPDYGRRTRYGAMLAPNTALILVRSPGGQGPTRPEGYPVGDFFSGLAWEFFDVLRAGDARFKNTKKTSEFFEKTGSRGQLLFLIEEIKYWNAHADLVGKCYGTLILVPIESMGGTRTMNVERLGEQLMYERSTSNYNREQMDEYVSILDSSTRRGSNTLYWEDVQVGDKLGPLVVPPFTLLDQTVQRVVSAAATGRYGTSGDELAFEPVYHHNRLGMGGYGKGFAHPVTRWPHGPGDEHQDALMAAYRGQPGPFDGGQHRSQLPHRLISDWMGDDGFIRRYQCALRKPVYYGDTTFYTAEVVKKFKESQEGDNEPGGQPGKAEYYAVGLKLEGKNQVGETQMQGTIAVYLPSREGGPVQLPLPHRGNPPYVPYETFYRDWY